MSLEGRKMTSAIRRSEMEALVSLLDDDNVFVLERVTARLRELGPAVVADLNRAAAAAPHKALLRVGSVLEQIRRDGIVRELTALIDSEEFDLEHAVFLLAMTRHPDLDIAHYTSVLDDMAEQVQRELDALDEPSVRQTAQAFGATLFGPAGLDGNLESYYDPDNSYISSVLDTKKGIPISLSTVGILVAKRLDLPVVGIGMPTHFLLGFEHEGGHVLIDPFNRGSIITSVSCKLRLEQIGVTWRDSYLDPVPTRTMLLRTVANLFLVYQQNGDRPQIEMLGELASILQASSTHSDPSQG